MHEDDANHPAPREGQTISARTCALFRLLDVFKVRPKSTRGRRTNPSIHNVKPTPSPTAGNWFSHRSRERDGGARRDRTDDLMLAKHALYQLSYGPKILRTAPGELRRSAATPQRHGDPGVVGPGRLELPTLRLSGVRSNQLSYGPMRRRSRRNPRPGSRSHLTA